MRPRALHRQVSGLATAAIIAAAAAVVGIGGAQPAAAAPVSHIAAGTHRVGIDIRPGTYRTAGGSGCYWERLRNFRGDLGSIIANDIASGPAVVTIKSTDRGFRTTRCARWHRISHHAAPRPVTRFGQGQYIVDREIRPGTYRAPGGSGCYWERQRDFYGTLESIIANDIGSGRVVVTIRSTDKGFKSSRCGTWVRT